MPIRERFEIQVVPPVWGRQPFLAVTDTSDGNPPRFEGSWGEAGFRLTEHTRGEPSRVLPVVLGKPSPGTSDRTDRIHPARRPVHRRRRHDQRRRRASVRPHAGPPGAAGDEGRARRRPRHRRRPGCRDLSAAAARRGRPARLGGDRRQRPPTHRSPRCRRPPSRSGAATDRARPGALGRRGTRRPGRRPARSRLELAERGRNWVHVTVLDDATGQPVPCRVHFRSPDGDSLPAARPPQPRQLEPRHLALRRRRRRPARPASATPTSTAPARAGCRAARCSSTWRAASNTSRSGRPCGSSRVSGS